jgi:hypothetical protein
VRAIGKITTFLVVAAVATGVVVGVRSIPEIKRYREIRQM